jgi:hypothetical protein
VPSFSEFNVILHIRKEPPAIARSFQGSFFGVDFPSQLQVVPGMWIVLTMRIRNEKKKKKTTK